MNVTKIEWCDFSANPLKFHDAAGKVVWGCVHESPGCKHCYAETIAARWDKGGPFNTQTMAKLTPFLDEKELHQMLTAKRIGGKQVSGSRCFVGDMTDIFGPWVPDELLDRLFFTFAARSDVTWQVLTKRAERMRDYFTQWQNSDRPAPLAGDDERPGFGWRLPLGNVWLGVSCEDQQRADERIPHLLQTPAAVRFVSAEPLLGPIELRQPWRDYLEGWDVEPEHAPTCHGDCEECPVARQVQTHHLDWCIVGGESGPQARPCRVAWVRDIVAQCKSAGVPCFVKQLGSQPEGDPRPPERRDPVTGARILTVMQTVEIHSRKGSDPSEWPSDLRVRQFPGEVQA